MIPDRQGAPLHVQNGGGNTVTYSRRILRDMPKTRDRHHQPMPRRPADYRQRFARRRRPTGMAASVGGLLEKQRLWDAVAT